MKHRDCYENHHSCNGPKCEYPFHVTEWSDKSDGWYNPADTVKTYKVRSAAEKYAAKLNANGGNYVVRSWVYMREG